MPPRRTLVVLWLLLYAWLYGWRLWGQTGVATADFALHFRAAAAVRAGLSPYVVPEHFYPPLMSLLIAPLVPLGYRDASRVWFLANHVLTLLAAWWAWRSLRRSPLAGLSVGATWLVAGSIASSLRQGQVNSLLLLLATFALWPAGDGAAAISVALAASIKVWPGVLWGGDLIARRWRTLVASLACAAALVLLPEAFVVARLAGPASPQRTGYSLGTPAFENHSLPGLLLRLLDRPRPGPDAVLPSNWVRGNQTEKLRLPRSQALASAAFSAALLLLGLGLMARRAAAVARDRAATGSTLLALGLCAFPVIWPHYQLLQLPGAARLAQSLALARRWTTLAVLAASFLVVSWSESLVLGPYLAHFGTRYESPLATWLLSSGPPLAGVALFVLHLRSIGREIEPATATAAG